MGLDVPGVRQCQGAYREGVRGVDEACVGDIGLEVAVGCHGLKAATRSPGKRAHSGTYTMTNHTSALLQNMHVPPDAWDDARCCNHRKGDWYPAEKKGVAEITENSSVDSSLGSSRIASCHNNVLRALAISTPRIAYDTRIAAQGIPDILPGQELTTKRRLSAAAVRVTTELPCPTTGRASDSGPEPGRVSCSSDGECVRRPLRAVSASGPSVVVGVQCTCGTAWSSNAGSNMIAY